MSTDIRASDLKEGDTYMEYGDFDPTVITKLDQHGDTILIWGECDGADVETTLDIDNVVELISRSQ